MDRFYKINYICLNIMYKGTLSSSFDFGITLTDMMKLPNLRIRRLLWSTCSNIFFDQ